MRDSKTVTIRQIKAFKGHIWVNVCGEIDVYVSKSAVISMMKYHYLEKIDVDYEYITVDSKNWYIDSRSII